MSHLLETIYTFAEALSAISLPIGGGLAAYAKWRRNIDVERRGREETVRIAAERAARDARRDERELRDRLLAEKDSRIENLEHYTKSQAERIASLNNELIRVLESNQRNGPE